jgi:adenylosuccinate synthase
VYGKIIVIVGGQYGSEGKGLIAGHLSSRESRPLLAVRVGGPNAGHTVWQNGKEFKLQSLPVAVVKNELSLLVSAAGSEVEWEQLQKELTLTADYNANLRYVLDEQATIIDPELHAGFHASSEAFGGTGKGTNRARAARMRREADLAYAWRGREDAPVLGDTAAMMRRHLQDGGCVMIEGTQGYGLGTHAGNYPYCTGNDCTAIDFLSQAGISPWMPYVQEFEVWVVLRTFPIRVAGNSGPFRAGETNWETLQAMHGEHIPVEQTTVTKKTRRVGMWDADLAYESVVANGGPGRAVHVALTFFDYIHPEFRDSTVTLGPPWERDTILSLKDFESDIGQPIELVGTGTDSVVDLR